MPFVRVSCRLVGLVSLIVLTNCLVSWAEDRPAAPNNSAECLRISKALYARAEQLEKRTKQVIPREFARVASNLDDFCQDVNFGKARVSIEWMETCLNNYTKDYKLGFCTRKREYFCAVFPDSDGCLAK
jgi:hypothetical protein